MQKEDWRGVIVATVILGCQSAVAGLVWGLAIGFDIVTGAMWGGIIGSGIVFMLSLRLSKFYSYSGRQVVRIGAMGVGRVLVIVIVIGLVVWLIRTLIS